jgi:cellulose biosynthesis protein BcsQ
VKVLATYSLKGGVGKTAAAVSLAYLAARNGASTLVWDLDPQGAASFSFRIKPKVKGGAKALVTGKRELDDVIKGTDYESLDLVPADFSYRYMDLLLDAVKKPARRIRRALHELGDEYEWVILDCPPGISLVSEIIIGVCDALLVPLIPTTLSLRTLDQLSALIDEAGGDNVAVLPFFSMVDRRKKLHREIIEQLPTERPELLRAAIPSSTDVEKMSARREPVVAFAPRSVATIAFTALWGEVQSRVGVTPTEKP